MTPTDIVTKPVSQSTAAGGDFFETMVLRFLGRMTKGSLCVTLPSGKTVLFGDPHTVPVELTILSQAFFKRVILFGGIGLGESFIDEQWKTNDLTALIKLLILNQDDFLKAPNPWEGKFYDALRGINAFWHRLKPNTVSGSRKNIEAHYDLSNEFYSLILDPTMTYSSAYFTDEKQSLEEAQTRKYEALCRKLKLKPSDHVLEIGSGWGGFAVHAAREYGCRITTITISQAQFDYAKERFKREGLDNQIDIQLIDYRHVKGQFDKIVSIEMIEAVGHDFLDGYFQQCHDLLKKDGILALQMITIPDERYATYRKSADFIQKHIFPGSHLPSVQHVYTSVRKAGHLGLLHFEDLSPSYARTLAIWRDNLNARREAVLKFRGFDPAFIRKWNYYFSYCEAAFASRNIGVAQVVFSHARNSNLF